MVIAVPTARVILIPRLQRVVPDWNLCLVTVLKMHDSIYPPSFALPTQGLRCVNY